MGVGTAHKLNRLVMASVRVAPSAGLRDPNGNAVAVDKLPEEMNDMKIRDDKVLVLCSVIEYLTSQFYLLILSSQHLTA